MDKLNLITAFISVADNGSIHKAAEELFQTDAAISRKISKLEYSLGVKLLERNRSGAVLTELGQRYYHQCKPAIKQLSAADKFVQHTLQEPQGKLVVICNDFNFQHWIVPKLKKFQSLYPKIELQFKIAEILPNFQRHKMDILFGVSFQGSDDLVRKRIGEYRHILCASPAYLRKHGTPQSASELLQHQFIAHGARDDTRLIMLNDETPVQMKPSLIINHTSSIINAALQHMGMIWVPDIYVAKFIQQQKLIEILPPKAPNKINVYLYHQMQKHIDPKITAFNAFFCDQH